jgi:hypothetical protein
MGVAFPGVSGGGEESDEGGVLVALLWYTMPLAGPDQQQHEPWSGRVGTVGC